MRDKKRINAALPAGVTEKDVQLFTRSQDKAKAFLQVQGDTSSWWTSVMFL